LHNQCRSINSRYNKRAVIFLDPFGMQVEWETIEVIAKTKAIDMWYLLPLGIGVNRLLKKDGMISEANRNKINDIFGSRDWYNTFYKTEETASLFGKETITYKLEPIN
jgi:three-Cys-motif partner protein